MRSSGSGSPPASFRLAEWVVDTQASRLVKGEVAIHLRPLLTDLLAFLASRRGEVVSKDELLDLVWQGRFVSDSVLSRTMAELRRILKDDFEHPRFIETIPKRGYRLIAEVGGFQSTTGPRLAVLPFENLNHDPDLDYFAAGMSDALTTELGNIAGLRVISRFSVLAMESNHKSLKDIARDLRVDTVVEGSVLHTGERVRVTAQLIQADPEQHLWAQSYVCDLRDILQLQGRVARAVAEAIQTTLTPQEVARLTRPRTVRPEAHLAYLKARCYATRWDRESVEKGLHYLEQAIQIDPDYAPPYALLSQAFAVLGYWGYLPIEVAYPQAKDAAMRAVHLDDALGEAHGVLGLMKWLMDWNYEACETEMRTGLELSPSNEIMLGYYALFLAVAREDFRQAADHARQLLDLDPLSMNSNFHAAWLHFFCRDYRAASDQALNTLEMYPDCLHAHYVLGWSALAGGRHEDAVAAFEKSAFLSRDAVSVAYLAISHARAGETESARTLLNELTEKRGTGDVPEFLFALVRASLGELDAAVESLERCFAAHDSRIFWFNVPPIGGPLPGYPRFDELMRRVEKAVGRIG